MLGYTIVSVRKYLIGAALEMVEAGHLQNKNEVDDVACESHIGLRIYVQFVIMADCIARQGATERRDCKHRTNHTHSHIELYS